MVDGGCLKGAIGPQGRVWWVAGTARHDDNDTKMLKRTQRTKEVGWGSTEEWGKDAEDAESFSSYPLRSRAHNLMSRYSM